jgi:hypothetical protein
MCLDDCPVVPEIAKCRELVGATIAPDSAGKERRHGKVGGPKTSPWRPDRS